MNTTFINEQIEDVRRLNKVAGATCPECKGVNGHATPFCSKVDLQSVLVDEDNPSQLSPTELESHSVEFLRGPRWVLRRITPPFSSPTLESVEIIPRSESMSGDWFWVTGFAAVPASQTFASEKESINAARKLRIDEMDRLQAEVNALDARYDAIEDAEMKAEGL